MYYSKGDLMRIEIKRDAMAPAIIITFHTKSEKFDSDYERMKFFRGLHGWKQMVPKEHKKYIYRRRGLLDEVPHSKIADSVFMMALEHMKRVSDYFNEWEDKVDFEIMKVMVEKQRLLNMLRE